MMTRNLQILILTVAIGAGTDAAETIAFWPFDEALGAYPSSTLSDHGGGGLPLVLGPGGSVVAGKFGNALSTIAQPEIELPMGSALFGLAPLPAAAGRTVPPLTWWNARFTALITAGENHLRKEARQQNPTRTDLNLGRFDWTVEFWYLPPPTSDLPGEEGVVFEIGEGPRGENNRTTALLLNRERSGFILVNQPAGIRLDIPSNRTALHTTDVWIHLAFVYDASSGRLAHYVDGREQPTSNSLLLGALTEGEEGYFTVGRDARWARPLPGAIDELRFSRGRVYAGGFMPPRSFVAGSPSGAPERKPHITLPLLFAEPVNRSQLVELGSRRHLLIDDALFPEHTNVTFVPTPSQRIELVFEVHGRLRKHLAVIEDEDGVIRLYSPIGEYDRLGVRTSRDGVHFDIPRLSTIEPDHPNIVTPESAGTPSVFVDPLAPAAERWKLISGDEGSGIFLFTSPDGYRWTRVPTAVLSARSGSQSNMFYDDQRGRYVGYHRTDIGENTFGKTERRFVLTTVDSLQPPWSFSPLGKADYDRAAETVRLDPLRPWYLDNGPLTPGGVGIEHPFVFLPIDGIDPPATDIYVPKAVKYQWAPDSYLAFPCVYFHYEGTMPATRSELGDERHGRGSGPIETQLMVSRDGVNWGRYPRPVWMNVGLVDGWDIHQTYMAQGMVRRGDEIWMYSYNTEEYHSTYRSKHERRGVFRTVHRADRFVAARAPYETEAMLFSRPVVFAGNRLVLNVDTHASGWLQVGLLHGDGRPIAGYGVDDCIYVNGNESRYEVSWLGQGNDLSAFAGKPVRLVVRMRGADLFSLQFVEQ